MRDDGEVDRDPLPPLTRDGEPGFVAVDVEREEAPDGEPVVVDVTPLPDAGVGDFRVVRLCASCTRAPMFEISVWYAPSCPALSAAPACLYHDAAWFNRLCTSAGTLDEAPGDVGPIALRLALNSELSAAESVLPMAAFGP